MSLASKGSQDGFIYVISLGFDDLYKIGCTHNLKQRMKALSPANPNLRLVMSYKVLWMKRVEKKLHGMLRAFHHSRELFRLNQESLVLAREFLIQENSKLSQIINGRCPKCGNGMVLRKNKKNGNKFYGCSQYPRCKATVSLLRWGNLDKHDPERRPSTDLSLRR